jgi:hypothetical protein
LSAVVHMHFTAWSLIMVGKSNAFGAGVSELSDTRLLPGAQLA